MKRTALAWKPAESAIVNAMRILPKLAREYFKAGRKLDRNSSPSDMHGFRLNTKQLRYTLEIFAPLYGPGLTARMETLRPIQNALGDLNDCNVLLAEMNSRLPHKARVYVQKRAREKHDAFLRYWREEFDIAGEDKKWEQYLTRFARVKRPN